MKVVILAGGLSPEREISFSSGTHIANALMENGHEVMLADIYLGSLNTMFPLEYHQKKDGYTYSYMISKKEPNLEEVKLLKKDKSLISEEVLMECKKADKVFLALHGSIGENGKLQSLLDIYGISYTGSSALGSMLAMHKDVAKRLMAFNGIITPKWKYFHLEREGIKGVSYPCVLKPCSNGSSIGVSMLQNEEELQDALKNVKDSEIIMEGKINGREFSVGILNGEALPIIEIIPKKDFYNYENKYQEGYTEEICPAHLKEEKAKELQDIALKVHRTLHLGNYSRIDFIMRNDGLIYCLEANSLPGMTPLSLLPKAGAVKGISYNELCEKILNESDNLN